MKCEKCGKKEATTFYKETINGNTREMNLCSDCAAELHIGADFENAFSGFASQLNSFWSNPIHSFLGGGFAAPWGAALEEISGDGTERTCPSCGMTESRLRQTGRAGCPECYHTFSDLLMPYIRQVHGADTHLGKKPETETKEEDPVVALKAKLQEAIRDENYEEAARLRDEIRRLEGEQK